MKNSCIREKCHVNTNSEADTFVGIWCENGDFTVNFPLGFSISDDERVLRKEILILLHAIISTTKKKESRIQDARFVYSEEGFPFQAYMYVLADYFAHGYYKESEVHFQVSKRGKIDWNRTIKTQKPYMQKENAFYLDLSTRKNKVQENELITLIHEYCVYDGMRKIGWLFTSAEPRKPKIQLNVKLFKSVITDKIKSTFNDRNRALFINMLAIIDFLQDENGSISYKCGTHSFEYVWETIIDRVFGIKEKSNYFPRTSWVLPNGVYKNACLEPDSIMVVDGNVYVLDAKYYKYGATKNPRDLPESTSINKQITYGEYIAEEQKFKKKHGDTYKTYNAFIMPFDMKKWNQSDPYKTIGIATSDWKHGKKEYESIVGIMIDMKHLMQMNVQENEEEIAKLAKVIQDSVFQ